MESAGAGKRREVAVTEEELSRMEYERNSAENAYFDARPQIDSGDRRRVFDAGFERGWKAANEAMAKE